MILPVYESGAQAVETEVFITDRDNRARIPLGDALLEVHADWDIDRTGSKGRVSVVAHRGALTPNMWIAPYRIIIPEVGEIVRLQRGHFKLGRASTRYDGTYAHDTGEAAVHQEAFGSDIVDDIAAVRLAETFTTPVDTLVMSDVRALLKMATAGRLGPNLVSNGTFNTSVAGWVTPVVATGVSRHSSSYGGSLENYFNASSPLNTLVQAYQEFTIPSDARYIMVSGLIRSNFTQQIAGRIYVDFKNSSGVIKAALVNQSYRTNSWSRVFDVVEVPAGTTLVRVYVQSTIRQAATFSVNMFWDDIRVGTATVMPIADARIALPPSTVTATTRIQTAMGKNFLYDAINGDRLSAVGHYALFTTMDGRPTTAPLRSLSTATPKRTYAAGDLRILSEIEIPAGSSDVPNHFIAIKEAFTEGAVSLFAEAFNVNPDDEFSVTNTGTVVSADPVHVPDAVDQAALQAVADAARDRQSTQEQITFSVTPDPELTVYDVIEITDPAFPAAMGKWAVEFISDDDPEMVISARRAIGGG